MSKVEELLERVKEVEISEGKIRTEYLIGLLGSLNASLGDALMGVRGVNDKKFPAHPQAKELIKILQNAKSQLYDGLSKISKTEDEPTLMAFTDRL